MSLYIALVRGINVGGHRPVAMANLRGLLAQLEFTDVRSLLQSGNLVFRGRKAANSTLERMLETEAKKRLRLEADFLVRSGDEWGEVVAQNPFRDEAERDPAHLVVVFLKSTPDADKIKALQAAIAGPEIVRANGRHAYIVYPAGIGTSRLTSALIERTLGTRGTARNWNTVLKLGALVDE